MQKIEIPTTCPSCGHTLETINDQLFCRNPSCNAQLSKKLEHFTKTLGIKGLGPKTLEKLSLESLPELFYLSEQDLKEALSSEKLAEKLFDEIERSKSADLATVLAAMSIPLVGSTASNKIAKVVSSIEDITEETCKIAGLGNKVTENLISWVNIEFQEMKEFLPFSFKSNSAVTSDTNGKTICITGKLTSYKTKAEATKLLEAAGFKVVESVTKTLNYLIDEEDKGSSKRQKADQYGVTIVTNINDFFKLERQIND